jgi:hypothetical protein
MQLSRARGFSLQAASRALNGLPAVVVARPSRWGNPYRVAPAIAAGGCRVPEITRELAVTRFRAWLDQALARWPSARLAIEELRGRNLACWCPLCAAHAAGRPLGAACPDCQPCHADVLLELANG